MPALLALIVAGASPAFSQEPDCDNPTSQMEYNECAYRDYEEADAELNAVYKQAMAQMRSLDEDLEGALHGAANALRDAQRAWIPFRDKACDSYGFIARGGSMEPQLVAACLAELTRQRTNMLKEMLPE